MTLTCQQCGAQHETNDAPQPGVIQKSRLKWCVPCHATTFHFAARSEAQRLQHREIGRRTDANGHRPKVDRRTQRALRI